MTTLPKALSLSVCLTPFAPGVERLGIADRGRWMVLWSAPPAKAMAEIAQRLGVHPRRLSIHQGAGPPDDHDDIEIRGPARGFEGDQVLALIAAGATGDQARAALAQLVALIDAQGQAKALAARADARVASGAARATTAGQQRAFA